MDSYAILWGFVGGLLSVVGTALTVSNNLNHRFSRLDSKIGELDHRLSLNLEKINGLMERFRASQVEHNELLGYQIHANRELIEHRSRRLTAEREQLEARLAEDIAEIKGYLEKSTSFVDRGRRQGNSEGER